MQLAALPTVFITFSQSITEPLESRASRDFLIGFQSASPSRAVCEGGRREGQRVMRPSPSSGKEFAKGISVRRRATERWICVHVKTDTISPILCTAKVERRVRFYFKLIPAREHNFHLCHSHPYQFKVNIAFPGNATHPASPRSTRSGPGISF